MAVQPDRADSECCGISVDTVDWGNVVVRANRQAFGRLQMADIWQVAKQGLGYQCLPGGRELWFWTAFDQARFFESIMCN